MASEPALHPETRWSNKGDVAALAPNPEQEHPVVVAAASRDRHQQLLELSRDVTAHLDLQRVLDTSLQALRTLLVFGGGAIQLIDEGALVARATDPPATPEALTVRIPVGQGVSGTIAATGVACYIPDITVDERVFPAGRAKGVSTGVRSYFGVPLILHGAPIGVVSFDSLEVDAFDDHDRDVVVSFVPTIAAAVQNAQLYEREVAATRQLRELERQRTDLIAVVSHELRTPLTSILGMAETLASARNPLPAEIVQELTTRIVSNSHRLDLLITDLLDVSQLEGGRLDVVGEPTDLRAVVDEAMRDLDVGRHPIEVRGEAEAPRVIADARRVHRVLGHLVSNAAKFSAPDAPITVSVEATPAGDTVVLNVTDEAPSIPPELREQIFEPFFQAEPADTRRVGGLGVGLFLVKRLCERMGATVAVEPAGPTGNRFTVAFRASVDGDAQP